jgi:hypothetical protein
MQSQLKWKEYMKQEEYKKDENPLPKNKLKNCEKQYKLINSGTAVGDFSMFKFTIFSEVLH